MLAKTGLLIVSNPTQISKVLSTVKKEVKNILYIQLLSALTDPLGHFYPCIFNSWPTFSQTIRKIYSQAAFECGNLDVRVLLSGLKYNHLKGIQTQDPIDLVIFDRKYSEHDINAFIRKSICNVGNECGFVTIDSGANVELNSLECGDTRVYNHTVLGGTFDRLHTAHKLLLSEAALRSQGKLTVGVTEENMLKTKTLWELVEPISTRVKSVESFLKDICPELSINVVPITDAFGPTQHDASMDLLVVSAETLKGGHKVNEVRLQNKLPPIEVLSVELIDEPYPNPNEETKISSSTTRMRLLGTLLKPVDSTKPASKPYVIGLTGGIASGKSNIAKQLEELGGHVIYCDLLAHELYRPGKDCHKKIIETFGNVVLTEGGEIDRKVLGGLVFKNPADLQKLNSIVWPAMADEVSHIIKNCKSDVVIVEAAVLLTAGWQDLCHEVWTSLVPKEEAVNRLKERNSLTEEQAVSRINSQPNNKFYVNSAQVVFCTLWPKEYTREQIHKAWKLLQARLPS